MNGRKIVDRLRRFHRCHRNRVPATPPSTRSRFSPSNMPARCACPLFDLIDGAVQLGGGGVKIAQEQEISLSAGQSGLQDAVTENMSPTSPGGVRDARADGVGLGAARRCCDVASRRFWWRALVRSSRRARPIVLSATREDLTKEAARRRVRPSQQRHDRAFRRQRKRRPATSSRRFLSYLPSERLRTAAAGDPRLTIPVTAATTGSSPPSRAASANPAHDLAPIRFEAIFDAHAAPSSAYADYGGSTFTALARHRWPSGRRHPPPTR